MQLRILVPGVTVAALALALPGCVGGDPAQPPASRAVAWQPGEVGALHNELLEEYYRLDHETGHERPRGVLLTRASGLVAARRSRPELTLPRGQVEALAADMQRSIGRLHEALASGDPAELGHWFEGAGIPREVGWRLLPPAHRPRGRQVLRPYEEMIPEDRQRLDRGLEVHAASGEFWRDRIPPDRDTRIGRVLDEEDAIMLADAAGAVAGGLVSPWVAPLSGAIASIMMEEALEAGSEDPQPICTCSCSCDCCGGGGDEDSGG